MKKYPCTAWLVSIHLGLACSLQAATPKRLPSVAVLQLSGQGVDAATSVVVTDGLSDGLLKTGRFRVMERSQIQEILQEQGFQGTGACEGGECAIQVGKLLAVDHVVLGSIGKLGESFTVSARVVDISTAEVVGSSRVMQRGEIDQVVGEALPKVCLELAEAIDRSRGIAVSSDRKSSNWGWWVAGGAVAVGGAVAAVLLLDGEESSAPPPAEPNESGSWQTTVRW